MEHRSVSEPRRAGNVRWWLWIIFSILCIFLAFSIQPARVQLYSKQGQELLRAGRVPDAIEKFQLALNIDPNRPETHFWLARCSRKLNDTQRLRQCLDEALRLGYDDQDRLKSEWWLYQAQTGNLRASESHLASLMKSAGDDGPEVCEAYAQGYCLNLQFDAALLLLETWKADAPNDYRPIFRIGQIYLDNKQQAARAETAFRAVIQLAPDYAPAYRELGRTLAALQRSDEAVSAYRQCLVLTQDDPAAMLALAVTLKELNRFKEAEEECRKLIQLHEQSERATTLLADILLADSRPDMAIEILTPLVQIWPEDLKIRYTLAMALQKAGRRDEAADHLKTYETLEIASKRMQELSQLLAKTPDNPELRFEFGSLRLRHESRDEGVAWLQSVLLINPNHLETHLVLAEFYSKTGDTVRADFHRRQLDELKNSFPTATEPRQK